MVMVYALDGPDVMEAVALDWEKIGIKPKRFPEMTSTFGPKSRNAQDEQDALGLRLAAVRRADPGLEPRASLQGRLQPAVRRPVRRGHRDGHAGVRPRQARAA